MGESPFDTANCLQDSEFKEGKTYWNYTSSIKILAINDSVHEQGNFSHYSPSVVGKQNIGLQSASYDGEAVTGRLAYNEGDVVPLKNPLIGGLKNLNVVFPEFLSNGCIITMKFNSGSSADVTIYDYDSTTPAAGYGSATYAGGVQSLNITLNGMSQAKDRFNIYIAVAYLGTINLDQVSGYVPPSQFQEWATIKQPFTVPRAENLSYSLNFTYGVSELQSIQQATLRAQINSTTCWNTNITSVSLPSSLSVPLPRTLLQSGGDFEVAFNLSLKVNTFAEVKFNLSVDNAYLVQTPVLDLLEDSVCQTGIPWDNSQSAANYTIVGDDVGDTFRLETNNSGRTGPEFDDGWSMLKQVFSKNLTQTEYQFCLDYKPTNLTGVDYANLTVQINNTVIDVAEIRSTSTSWQHLRWNASPALQENGTYTLNVTARIKLKESHPLVDWECNLDNIYLYPLWNSSLVQQGDVYDGNVSAGEQREIWFTYNTTGTNLPIRDAAVIVRNNDTGIEWGLEFSSSVKYFINNFLNGTYVVGIASQGCDIGLYNLSVTFERANFPDTPRYFPLNVSGALLTMQYTYGVHHNSTYDMWFVDDDNTPYVNDSTSKISLLITNSVTFELIDNAFIDAWLGDNIFPWTERYKLTHNAEDRGYYDININTTGLNPAFEYLVYNFTISVSAINYTANKSILSTKINALPTDLLVPDIDSFYEGSAPELTAFFQDTYNHEGINDADLTWEIEGTPNAGHLNFLYFGYYKSFLSTEGLQTGLYYLQVTGQKEGYEIGFFELQIEILAKWNASAVVTLPVEIFEGNQYSFWYNFTCKETGQPLVGEQVDFMVQYGGISQDVNYTRFVGSDGLVNLALAIPLDASSITIDANYAGKYNISTLSLHNASLINQKFAVQLVLLNEGLSGLIGDSNLELRARLTFSNGTGISGALLFFTVGSSEASAITDESGFAIVFIKLPSEGSFPITITYTGSTIIQASSIASDPISVLSPVIAFTTVAIIVGVIVVGGYLTLDRGILRPRKRKRNASLKELTRRFDDAENNLMLMVIDNEAGVEVFSTSFSTIPMDPTLVSGFLSAISTFGQELLSEDTVNKFKGPKARKAMVMRGHQEINYHHFKIIMQEIRTIRIAVIVLKTPSPRALENFQEFARKTETRFGPTMPTRKGRQIEDDEIWDLIEEYFEPSLTYPHVLDCEVELKAPLSRWEKIVAKNLKGVPFCGGSYLEKLYEEMVFLLPGKDVEILKNVLSLRQKHVLLPVPQKFLEFYSGAVDTIQDLSDVQKQLVLHVGGGAHTPSDLLVLIQIDENQLEAIVHPLRDTGIIQKDYTLGIPGKILLAFLKYKVK